LFFLPAWPLSFFYQHGRFRAFKPKTVDNGSHVAEVTWVPEGSLTGVVGGRRLALEVVSGVEFWCKFMFQASTSDLGAPGVDARPKTEESRPEKLAKLPSGTKATARLFGLSFELLASGHRCFTLSGIHPGRFLFFISMAAFVFYQHGRFRALKQKPLITARTSLRSPGYLKAA